MLNPVAGSSGWMLNPTSSFSARCNFLPRSGCLPHIPTSTTHQVVSDEAVLDNTQCCSVSPFQAEDRSFACAPCFQLGSSPCWAKSDNDGLRGGDQFHRSVQQSNAWVRLGTTDGGRDPRYSKSLPRLSFFSITITALSLDHRTRLWKPDIRIDHRQALVVSPENTALTTLLIFNSNFRVFLFSAPSLVSHPPLFLSSYQHFHAFNLVL